MASIAVYERDDLMRGLLREWLLAAGYSVRDSVGAANGRVDLVIVSISMPRPDGEAAIRRVRALHPAVPLIALSSQARSGLSSNGATARALGVQRLMAKPLTRHELLAAVQAVLATPVANL